MNFISIFYQACGLGKNVFFCDICIVTLTCGWGGTEVQTSKLIESLVINNFKVCLIQINHNLYSERLQKIAKIYNITINNLDSFYSFFKLYYYFKTIKASIWIFPKGAFDVGSIVIDMAIKIRSKRYITIEHGLGSMIPKRPPVLHRSIIKPRLGFWWYREVAKRFLRSHAPCQLICVSAAIKTRIVNGYKCAESRLRVVHNGVDPHLFCFSDDYREIFRTEWQVPQNAIVFGVLGRLSKEKGFDIAIRCFNQLISAGNKNVYLVIAGDGPEEITLKKLTKNLGCDSRVIFVGKTDEPWVVYSAMDCFLLPSITEGLPLSLLEAMSCKCVPVAFAVGGVPEILNSRKLGWLVPSEDTKNFLRSMEQFINLSKVESDEIKIFCRKKIIDSFQEKNQINLLLKTIQTI